MIGIRRMLQENQGQPERYMYSTQHEHADEHDKYQNYGWHGHNLRGIRLRDYIGEHPISRHVCAAVESTCGGRCAVKMG